ncbi:MAG TPA: NadS family protein [Bauldia sp.]|nr:NadS family protein [Bauldia sp.]
MSKLGKRLLKSVNEAVAIAEGKAKPARVLDIVDVAAIRKSMNLSQSEFAERYRLSPATVRDWEQGRRAPDRAANNYLLMIQYAPKIVEKVIDQLVTG